MLTILVTCVVEEFFYQIAQMPKTLHKWPKNVHLSPKCTNAQKIEQISKSLHKWPKYVHLSPKIAKWGILCWCRVEDFVLMLPSVQPKAVKIHNLYIHCKPSRSHNLKLKFVCHGFLYALWCWSCWRIVFLLPKADNQLFTDNHVPPIIYWQLF